MASTFGFPLVVEAATLTLGTLDAVVEMERRLVALDHRATTARVLARTNRLLQPVDVAVLGESDRGLCLPVLKPLLRLVRLAFHGVWIVDLARIARGLEHVAAQARPLVDPLFGLLAHGQHAAVPRPPKVVAQIVLLVVCAVVGADRNPRGHAPLSALLVAAAVVLMARCLPHPIPLVLARLLLWGELFPVAHVAVFCAQPLHDRTLLGSLGPVLGLEGLRKGVEGGEKILACPVCSGGPGRHKQGHVNVLVSARVVTPAPQAAIGIDARGQYLDPLAMLCRRVPMVHQRVWVLTRFTLQVPRLRVGVVERTGVLTRFTLRVRQLRVGIVE